MIQPVDSNSISQPNTFSMRSRPIAYGLQSVQDIRDRLKSGLTEAYYSIEIFLNKGSEPLAWSKFIFDNLPGDLKVKVGRSRTKGVIQIDVKLSATQIPFRNLLPTHLGQRNFFERCQITTIKSCKKSPNLSTADIVVIPHQLARQHSEVEILKSVFAQAYKEGQVYGSMNSEENDKFHRPTSPKYISGWPRIAKEDEVNRVAVVNISLAHSHLDTLLKHVNPDVFAAASSAHLSATNKTRLLLEAVLDEVIRGQNFLSNEQATDRGITNKNPPQSNSVLFAREVLMHLDDCVWPLLVESRLPFFQSFPNADAALVSIVGIYYKDILYYKARGMALALISPEAAKLQVQLNAIHLFDKGKLDPGDIVDICVLSRAFYIYTFDGLQHIKQFPKEESEYSVKIRELAGAIDVVSTVLGACGGYEDYIPGAEKEAEDEGKVINPAPLSLPSTENERGAEELQAYYPKLNDLKTRLAQLKSDVKFFCNFEQIPLLRLRHEVFPKMTWRIAPSKEAHFGGQAEHLFRAIITANAQNRGRDPAQTITINSVLDSTDSGNFLAKHQDIPWITEERNAATVISYGRQLNSVLQSVICDKPPLLNQTSIMESPSTEHQDAANCLLELSAFEPSLAGFQRILSWPPPPTPRKGQDDTEFSAYVSEVEELVDQLIRIVRDNPEHEIGSDKLQELSNYVFRFGKKLRLSRRSEP